MNLRTSRLLAAVTVSASAVGAGESDNVRRLADLTLEELMNETVTSVSKSEERLSDVAAAVTNVSVLDLQQDGATTLPDLLRVVPGVQVSANNAREWAVSARGFNQVYSNKLLVLIDGRAVYTPLFGGVFWILQQRMIEDIDRIEVIRGPGASIWGANAVNGVVNVVGKDARETQGSLVFVAAGDVLRRYAGARYGGMVGNITAYRVFAVSQSVAESPRMLGGYDDDDWASWHFGFRVDHAPAPSRHLTFQSDATKVVSDGYRAYNVNAIARLNTALDASKLEAQVYFDRTHTDDATQARQTTDTLDLNVQQSFGNRRDTSLVWGAGARGFTTALEDTSPAVRVQQHRVRRHLFSAFAQVQDRSLSEQVTLTGGVKFELNSYTGLEVQPTLRLAYKPRSTQTVWFAASRAVRTPGEVEGKDTARLVIGSPVGGPGGGLYLPVVVGEPGLRSEVLYAAEAGWRMRAAQRLTADITVFHYEYSRLISYGPPARFEAGSPLGTVWIPWRNAFGADSHGGEIATAVAVTSSSRVELSYTAMALRTKDAGEYTYGQTMSQFPSQQALIRVVTDLGPRCDASMQFRWVAAMPGVPSYRTADARVAFHPFARLDLSLVGRNLLAPAHIEQTPVPLAPTAAVPRSVHVRVDWRF